MDQRAVPSAGDTLIQEKTLELATTLRANSRDGMTSKERDRDHEVQGMVQNPEDLETLAKMTDCLFAIDDPQAAGKLVSQILTKEGIPSFPPKLERFGLELLRKGCSDIPFLSPIFRHYAVPQARKFATGKAKDIILPAEEPELTNALKRRSESNITANVNSLGEAITSEAEVRNKTKEDIEKLRNPHINVISVKASNLYSQIAPYAHEYSVECVKHELRERLRVAKQEKRSDYDSESASKWDKGYKTVNLDMEEYRDLNITIDAFKQILMEEEFRDVQLGVALQMYIPDSFDQLKDLIDWSREKMESGERTAPIRVRVVKGANRPLELIDASVHGHETPTFNDKLDTDANWLRAIDYSLRPENLQSCHIGIASHNDFSLAFARFLCEQREIKTRNGEVVFEMLEGMNNHTVRSVQEDLGDVLVYLPAVAQEQFKTAFAYFLRRLVEMSDEAHYLSKSNGVDVTDEVKWRVLCDEFLDSFARMGRIHNGKHRTHNHIDNQPELQEGRGIESFKPCSDTDWTHPKNHIWIAGHFSDLERRFQQEAEMIKLHEGDGGELKVIRDRYHNSESDPRVLAEVRQATHESIDQSIDLLASDQAKAAWTDLDPVDRTEIFRKAATLIEEQRGELIAIMASETGKVVSQSDPEISEAIDFCNFYGLAAEEIYNRPNLEISPKGTGVAAVIPPWNFPGAIPIGSSVAALSAGNRVLLKPSPESMYTTYRFAKLLWDAGVPKEALQIVLTDNKGAERIIENEKVSVVNFTGSTNTVDEHIIKKRPDLDVVAETGGKNFTIVTNSADIDAAVKNIINSAFSNCGQKCSATSVIAAFPEIYKSPHFKRKLKEAAESLLVGDPKKPETYMGPLIRNPSDMQLHALTTLEHGEEWVLKPKRLYDDRDDTWTPGMKIGTTPGSISHTTEFFVPVLSIMKVRDLDHACDLIEDTDRGLTLGLETLDDQEARYLVEKLRRGELRVGNFYRNTSTVGALVDKQSFGGMLGSRRGQGLKAGGENYPLSMMDIREKQREDGVPRYDAYSLYNVQDFRERNDDQRFHPPERLEGLTRVCDRVEDAIDPVVRDAHKQEIKNIHTALRSQIDQMVKYFSRDRDSRHHIRGEHNITRHVPVGSCCIRISPTDTPSDIFTRVAASFLAGNKTIIRYTEWPRCDAFEALKNYFDPFNFMIETAPEEVISVVKQPVSDFRRSIQSGEYDVVRYSSKESAEYENAFSAAAGVLEENGVVRSCFISHQPVLRDARIELTRYMQEQTVRDVYHRFGGNLRPELNPADAKEYVPGDKSQYTDASTSI